MPDSNIQALMREMERLFDRKLEPIEDRLYQVEARGQRERTPEEVRRRRGSPKRNREELYESCDQESDHSSIRSVQN